MAEKVEEAEEEEGGGSWVGCRVRVAVEDVVFKLRFGDEGKVDSVTKGTAQVHFDKSLSAVDVPLRLLERGPFKKSKPLKTFARVSLVEKQGLLMSLGVGNPTESTIEEVPTKGDELLDENVDVYGIMTMWSLSSLDDSKISYVPLSLTRAVLRNQGCDQGMEEQALPELAAKQLRAMMRLVTDKSLVLMPVWGGGHFVLMALRKGCTEAAYYDSLSKPSLRCKQLAERLLQIIGFEHLLPLRMLSEAVQPGATCGLFACHYLEDEVRAAIGEGHGCNGWPNLTRLKAIREYLSKSTTVLRATVTKWAEQELLEEKKREKQKAQLLLRAMETLRKKDMLEILAKRQAEIAAMLTSAGSSSEPVPLPEGFGEKPKQKLEEKKAQLEAEKPPTAKPPLPPPADDEMEPVEGEAEKQPTEEPSVVEQPKEAEAKKDAEQPKDQL